MRNIHIIISTCITFIAFLLVEHYTAFEIDDSVMPAGITRVRKIEQMDKELNRIDDDCNRIEGRYDHLGVNKTSSSVARSRRKRAVFAWPARSRFTAELYYRFPLVTPDEESVVILLALGAPFTFLLPNVTRDSGFRSLEDRLDIYSTIEGILSGAGMDGRECLLKVMCEKEELAILHNGLLSELIEIVLEISTDDSMLYDYREATLHGRHHGDCRAKYSKCSFSLFKILGSGID